MTEGIPTKRIISRAHLDAFLSSETHADVVAFVEKLNESVVGVKLTDPLSPSAVRFCPSASTLPDHLLTLHVLR